MLASFVSALRISDEQKIHPKTRRENLISSQSFWPLLLPWFFFLPSLLILQVITLSLECAILSHWLVFPVFFTIKAEEMGTARAARAGLPRSLTACLETRLINCRLNRLITSHCFHWMCSSERLGYDFCGPLMCECTQLLRGAYWRQKLDLYLKQEQGSESSFPSYEEMLNLIFAVCLGFVLTVVIHVRHTSPTS